MTSREKFHCAIYTDGSCLGNPGPGGYAAIIQYGAKGEKEKIISGGESDTTNNRMEMTAVIEALHWVKKNILPEVSLRSSSESLPSSRSLSLPSLTVVSDSKLLIETLTKGWKKKKNQDLWAALEEAQQGLRIVWSWVKGHATHAQNNRADEVAVKEAQRIKKTGEKTKKKTYSASASSLF